jgi:hypothetical protein
VRNFSRKALLCTLILAAGSAESAWAQVNVTVDATKAVRTVDSRVFGLNTAAWDWSFDSSQTTTLLAAAGTNVLRYPGGGTSDTYFWSNNTVENTDSNNVPNGTYSTLGTDFDQFASIALAQKAQAFITVNYGTSTPTDAAKWVAYSKLKGYGFKYWEVGNENYGTWETDINSPAHDPVEYATRFVQYYTAMKAADPTIKVGAVATTSTEGTYSFPSEAVTDPVTGVKHSEWDYIILSTMSAAGVMPDFLICHRYEQNAGQENDATLLQLASQASTGWPVDAALLRTPLNDFYGSAASGAELCVTENNSVHNNPGKQIVSLVNALYYADSFGSLLQTEFNSCLWWCFRGGPNTTGNDSSTLYGWLTTFGDYGVVATNPNPAPTGYPAMNTPFAPYYAIKLMTHFAASGDTVVTATSNNNLLSAYAVKRLDGSLCVMVINKSPMATETVNFSLTGFPPLANANVYSYGIPQDDAAKTGSGSADIATSTVSNAGSTFSESVGPYSITIFDLASETSAPVALSQPNSLTVAVGSTAVFSFQASGGPAPTLQWYLNGAPISGAISSTLVVGGATSANAGSYTCIATNASGTLTSSAATLAVVNTANPGRLTNLSCRAVVGTASNVIIAGFVSGGANTSGTQGVLVRGSGPALGIKPFSLVGVLADPVLTLTNVTGNENAMVATNSGWGGITAIANEAALLGAFSWGTAATADSALYETALTPGNYTAEIAGKSGDTGIALVEVYDATPAATYTLTSPRLTNLSARVQVGTGANVVYAGFVIGGDTAKTVLIRASGPALSLAPFAVSGTLADPQLTLTNVGVTPNVVIATNTGWAGDPQIYSVAHSVGAFTWGAAATADSALLVTLPPGNYTAGVQGASADTGVALIELYEVP